jgi:hypothetical protein
MEIETSMRRDLLFKATNILFSNLNYKLQQNNINKDRATHIHAYEGFIDGRVYVEASLSDNNYMSICNDNNEPITSLVDLNMETVWPNFDGNTDEIIGNEFRNIVHVKFYDDKLHERLYF